MKKKSRTYIGMFLLGIGISLPAGAQNGLEVRIVSPRTEVVGELLAIDLTIETKSKKIRTTERYSVDFILQGAGQQYILPEVVYYGKQRYDFDRRQKAFSTGEKAEPYHIGFPIDGDGAERLDYKLSVPCEPWMEDATLSYSVRRNDCGEEIVQSGILVNDVQPAREEKPLVWEPDPEVYRQWLHFQAPEAEPVKRRTLVLEYSPRDSSDTDEFENIAKQLNAIFENPFATVDSVRLTGCSDPDGPARTNASQARVHAEALKARLVERLGEAMKSARIDRANEDWEALNQLVRESGMAEKENILSVIEDPDNTPEVKERIIRSFRNGAIWERMKKELFPALQRTQITVAYTLANLTDDQLREQIVARPGILSTEEWFRAALLFEAGSPEQVRTFETAWELHPEIPEAASNAAAARLSAGETEQAARILRKIKETPQTMIHLGVYYYIVGDLEKAEQCFARAQKAGWIREGQNLPFIE
jgi:tetratricopeptide (TPR) repeat protein